MTTPELLTLRGCAPTPLASYLKALGVLRLISSDANHVDGKAADTEARGWWEKEKFNLKTRLNRDELCHFFLENYAPSPVIAPWNGGSGFFPKDNKDGFGPLCATIIAKRFLPIANAINMASKVLACQGLTERPEGIDKVEFVATLRAEISDEALDWIDSALALSGDGLTYPQLLGTGGNDGRLDFTNNFMRRLVSKKRPVGIFNVDSGKPSIEALPLLSNALFDTPADGLASAAIGQFSPGSAGGPNDGVATVNPWDFILLLEGAIAFAGAATRRHQGVTESGASFPFTVQSVGAGWGGVEATDENDARAEFWAPLWNRAARFREVDALLVEGRAVLNGRTARNGLEFARAVSGLGTSRGFSEFERYGFLMRSGKSYLATPVGRRTAAPSLATQLIADFDTGGWLEKVRRVGRGKEEPTAARTAIKRFEDALFDLAETADMSPSAAPIQSTLVALGEICKWLSYSRKGREAVGAPPPAMSTGWIWRANDNSPEFRVAAALAGVGLAPIKRREDTAPETTIETMEKTGVEATENDVPQVMSPATPPMAAHFLPIDEARFSKSLHYSVPRTWSKEEAPPSVVWDSSGLVSNMITVLERRLVESTIRGLKDKPLASAVVARLDDVRAFLDGEFDDARCAALLAGMIWVRPTNLSMKREPYHKGVIPASAPFAYSALKTIFSPNRALHRINAIAETAQMPIPPGLVAQLRSGASNSDGFVTDAAVRVALNRARASGLPSPFESWRAGGRSPGAETSRIGVGIRPDRMAAALLIPIDDRTLKLLVKRVFSKETIESAEDTNDAG